MIEVPADFLAFLKHEENRAQDYDTDERRKIALDFYNGELFGDEEEGRSQLVTRDVAEVIDYMTVSIARTIISGDRVVEFEGRSLAQEQYADQATETVQQQFMRRQNGYRLVHDWIKAGLLEITGVVKTYAEQQDPKRAEHQNIHPMQLAAMQQQGAKIVEMEDAGAQAHDGEPLFHAALHIPQPPKFCDVAVPNEEFKVAPDARDLDSAHYLAHVPPKTVSDLVAMGFDEADLDVVAKGADVESVLAQARDGNRLIGVDRTGANRRVDYREEHVLYDLNGDGVAERLIVHRVGDHILDLQEEDDHPFEEWCPFPMPHRRIGQSLAEKVMDIQRSRSVVLRQTMDGFYFANAPRTYLNEDSMGDTTVDDLLTVRPGQIVRYKGAVAPLEQQPRFDPQAGLSMLEQLNGERESRTGITRLNQGLDADTLNKTATGTALMQAQGQQIEEYLARNFAEALGRLFAKKLKLLKRYGGIQPLKIEGEYKQVDPSQWDEDMDLNIRVGLGSGRKDQRLMYRQQLLQIQQLCMEGGLRIVGEKEIFNSLRGFVADTNLGNIGDFAQDPEKMPPAPPQPKPDEIKAQADAQKSQVDVQAMVTKMQLQQQNAQQQSEAHAQKMQLNANLANAKAQTDAYKVHTQNQNDQAQAQFEAHLAEQKTAMEYQLKQQELALEAAHKARLAENDRAAQMSQNRPGGDISK